MHERPLRLWEKDFWNVGGPTQITEYKVAQKPVKTLSVNTRSRSSCAMNTSGDLAVGILWHSSGRSGGQVVIFKNAKWQGYRLHTRRWTKSSSTATTTSGNLFADGFTGDSSGFTLVELPKGTKNLKLSQPATRSASRLRAVGRHVPHRTRSGSERDVSIHRQWNDGDVAAHHIVHGSRRLRADLDRQGAVYCGDAGNATAKLSNTRHGGSPVAVFTGNFDLPLGVTAARR